MEEFHDVLERMGFTISLSQVYELMCKLDENFDGRVSYAELRAHIEKLGFDMRVVDDADKKYSHDDS